MKKLAKERKKFNRDYLKPLVGCGILFILIVGFLIIFGYNPKDTDEAKKKTNNYYVNLEDKAIDQNSTCDSDFYRSIIEEVNKIDLSFKVGTVEGEKVVDNENSTEDNIVYYTREYYAYEMTMNNIPKGVKAVVTDNKTENVNTLANGSNTFTSTYTITKVTYTVNIYGDSDNCKDVLLRQFTFITPVLNIYSETSICENNDDKNCDIVTYNETDVSSALQKSMEEKINEEAEKKDNFIKIIVASILIVIIIAVVIFIYYKRRRKRMVM